MFSSPFHEPRRLLVRSLPAIARSRRVLRCGAVVLGLISQPVQGTSAQSAASVTIQAGTPLSTVRTAAFGVNTAAWDGLLLDGTVPSLLKQAGVTALRFPGGSVTDVYHWQTNTASQGQYINPNNTFDAFMGVVNASAAQALICVNYGTNTAGNAGGDPSEAAAWVAYANQTKGYGVKYWEVGNEVYGNGEYGSAFETDLHSDHSPTAYGQNVVQYVSAMKAQDATIKVGAVLTAPGQYPDGQSPDWNTNVLAQCGGVIDFVIVHWYPQQPGSESDSFLLNAPASQIASMVATLRSLISQSCGSNAANVQIFVTETNSVAYNPGKQTVSLVNGLFIADDYATWLEQGVANVDIWTLHNGTSGGNTSGSLYGSATYGDYGILSSGQSPEPASDTPFPAYYGIQMLSDLGKAGDQFVSVSSSQSLLGVHAVRQAGGNLALLLINKDPVNSDAATVSVSGFAPATSSTDYFYGESSGSGGISSADSMAGATFTRTVPPYSLTTVVMQPSGGTPTPTPTDATFFTGQSALGDGVYFLQFPDGVPFGYYSYLTDPAYLYHFDLGYEYVFDADDGNSGVYFYDFASRDFFYTSPAFPFPYLYDFALNTVLYYYPDTTSPGHYTTNPRYFYDFAAGAIITK